MQNSTGYYRIKNWHEYYENSQSKKYKNLSWVPIPNKHDGRKFREICALDPTGGTFTAFILMVEIASKSEERGCLVDSDGSGLEPFDFQLMTGYPASIFETAIKILSSRRIAWIEFVPDESDRSIPESGSTMEELGSLVEASNGLPNPPDFETAQHLIPSASTTKSGSVLEDSGSIRNNSYATQNRTEQNRTELNNSSNVRTRHHEREKPEPKATAHAADENIKPLPTRLQDAIPAPKPDDPEYEAKKEIHLIARKMDAAKSNKNGNYFEGQILKIPLKTWEIWIDNLGLLPGQLAQACAILDVEISHKKIRDPLSYASKVLLTKSHEGSLHTWMRRCKPQNLDVRKFIKGEL